MPGVRTDRTHGLAYDLADALLAPWPETAHTDGWPAAWRGEALGRRRPVAASTADAPAPGEVSGTRPGRCARTATAVGTTGGDGTPRVLPVGRRRPRHVDGAGRDARAATPGWHWVERGPGSPSPDLWSDLAAADVVVTHGGQNAVAEVAAARRPAVVVAQPRPFDEQVATARAVDRLGGGRRARRVARGGQLARPARPRPPPRRRRLACVVHRPWRGVRRSRLDALADRPSHGGGQDRVVTDPRPATRALSADRRPPGEAGEPRRRHHRARAARAPRAPAVGTAPAAPPPRHARRRRDGRLAASRPSPAGTPATGRSRSASMRQSRAATCPWPPPATSASTWPLRPAPTRVVLLDVDCIPSRRAARAVCRRARLRGAPRPGRAATPTSSAARWSLPARWPTCPPTPAGPRLPRPRAGGPDRARGTAPGVVPSWPPTRCARRRTCVSSGRCPSPSPCARGAPSGASTRATSATAARTPTSGSGSALPADGSCGWEARGPTTSTTRPRRLPCSTCTTSSPTPTGSPSAGAGGPWRDGSRRSPHGDSCAGRPTAAGRRRGAESTASKDRVSGRGPPC